MKDFDPIRPCIVSDSFRLDSISHFAVKAAQKTISILPKHFLGKTPMKKLESSPAEEKPFLGCVNGKCRAEMIWAQ